MAEIAWLVSLVADFAQIISIYRSGTNSFSKNRWHTKKRKSALKLRWTKSEFKVSFKRTIKHN